MEINFFSLGTDISIQIVSDDVNSGVEGEIKKFYQEREKIFSRFSENSELSYLNKKLLKYNKASSDIIEVADKCLIYHKQTEGYFDPRIINVLENIGYNKDFKKISQGQFGSIEVEPLSSNLEDDLKINGDKIYFGRRMDFSGIAKGYITDEASEFLRQKGYDNFLVDSGGDIRVSGKDEDGESWMISVEGMEEEKILLELDNDFLSVATSGITRKKWENKSGKFHHLINPKELNKFSFDLKSVTVVAKTCEEADVWAKNLFLMGKDEGLKFSEKNNIRSLFLDYRGNVYLSPEMKNNIYVN
jgi:thiamine biosynthesis lipoprotein